MLIFLIVAYVICGCYLVLNLKHDIHMLQQNSYRPERYWKYLKNDISSTSRLIDVALLFLVFSTLVTPVVAALIVSCVALSKVWLILNKKFKKPLVFTKRVWRIYGVAGGLSLGGWLAVMLTAGIKNDIFGMYSGITLTLGMLLCLTIFSWAVVMLAVFILSPVEKLINDRYRNDAKRILDSMGDMTVVGITGSYGKTSTKHYLERILSEEFDVLMTPGSYNTPMGVIRTVREMMKPYHKIFICEMGAKQVGDIKEICDLVNPQLGIVTAVGPMHLETFKSMENVQKTKFELVDALPADGLAVVNNDFEYCASRKVDNVEVARYGVDKVGKDGSDWWAEEIVYSPEGTDFTVRNREGRTIRLHTRLVGSCNISNLLAAVIIALRLGMSEEKIKRGVAAIEQVEHRLSIKRTPGGVTIIDDAFNSNPTGSRMALEVLSEFKGGKRIVVTPGMIELGDKQNELNEELGERIAESCDVAIIVGYYNRGPLTAGIIRKKFNRDNLYEVESFDEAQKVLGEILESGDTVLYENDLPDSFK